jgi:DNA end-binding protein Ku
MPVRPTWRGAISFGMVVIPVHMYKATENKTVAFHLLHRKCHSRARIVYRCEEESEYFGLSETLRAYEYAKGEYVTFEPADFEKLPLKSLHTVEVSSFAPVDQVDPVSYKDAYYLEPEELGARPFALFRDALKTAGRVAIARITFAQREHLCCLRTEGEGIVLHTLYYHDEVRSPETLPAPQSATKPEELELAITLINAMQKDFHPEEYEDEYRRALEAVVRAKVAGKEMPQVEPAAPPMADFMAALRASIEAAKSKQASSADNKERSA